MSEKEMSESRRPFRRPIKGLKEKKTLGNCREYTLPNRPGEVEGYFIMCKDIESLNKRYKIVKQRPFYKRLNDRKREFLEGTYQNVRLVIEENIEFAKRKKVKKDAKGIEEKVIINGCTHILPNRPGEVNTCFMDCYMSVETLDKMYEIVKERPFYKKLNNEGIKNIEYLYKENKDCIEMEIECDKEQEMNLEETEEAKAKARIKELNDEVMELAFKNVNLKTDRTMKECFTEHARLVIKSKISQIKELKETNDIDVYDLTIDVLERAGRTIGKVEWFFPLSFGKKTKKNFNFGNEAIIENLEDEALEYRVDNLHLKRAIDAKDLNIGFACGAINRGIEQLKKVKTNENIDTYDLMIDGLEKLERDIDADYCIL